MGHTNDRSTKASSLVNPTSLNLQPRPFAPLESDEKEEAVAGKSGYSENFLEKIINTPRAESATPVQRKSGNRLKAIATERTNTAIQNQPIQRQEAVEEEKSEGEQEEGKEFTMNPEPPPVQRKFENRLRAKNAQRMAIQAKLAIGEPNDKYEQEADATAARVVQQINSPTTSQGQPVQRKFENRLRAKNAQRMEIQAKLAIGEPNDKYEQEADATAARVVQQINSSIPSQSLPIQRQEMEEDEELQMKPLVQRSENIGGGEASTDLESAIQSARGSGQSLDANLQQSMGQAMGADFSDVKVHTDSQSDQLNKSIQAKAFTTGQDLFFRQGAYEPSSRGGQELIAHELTHVVQQGGGRSNSPHIQAKLISEDEVSGGKDPKDKDFEKLIKAIKPYYAQPDAGKISYLERLFQMADDYNTAQFAKASKLKEDKRTEILDRTERVYQLKVSIISEIDAVKRLGSRQVDAQEVLDSPGEVTKGGLFSKSKQLTVEQSLKKKSFTDFDGKQFRISGKPPNTKVEEVKREVSDDDQVEYYATGEVISFTGKHMPVIKPYDQPVSLGAWYPKVTHVNGMNVKPTTGLRDATDLHNEINNELAAKMGGPDAAIDMESIDVLWTYSAKLGKTDAGSAAIDKWKGDGDDARDIVTQEQHTLMLDAVNSKHKTSFSAHSRGTIKTDNAVRNTFRTLSGDYFRAAYLSAQAQKEYDDTYAACEQGKIDTSLLDSEMMAEICRCTFATESAKEKAKSDMDEYITLVYAGNAVKSASEILPVNYFVGTKDSVSKYLGTSSQKRAKAQHTESEMVIIQGGKHSYAHYAELVGKAIATDLLGQMT